MRFSPTGTRPNKDVLMVMKTLQLFESQTRRFATLIRAEAVATEVEGLMSKTKVGIIPFSDANSQQASSKIFKGDMCPTKEALIEHPRN
jgi:hypothetical protein